MNFKTTISLLIGVWLFLSLNTAVAEPKTHSWFFKVGKVNCPAVVYYTVMSVSSSTSSDSCENINWIVKNGTDEQERFVVSNYSLLEMQVSQGQGALIADYAEIMNCPGAPSEFGAALRNNFDKVFTSDRSEEKLLERTLEVIRSEPGLANKCLAGA